MFLIDRLAASSPVVPGAHCDLCEAFLNLVVRTEA
jgi:hypothetical protein